jgi:LCP family protein required for cell wall assembly
MSKKALANSSSFWYNRWYYTGRKQAMEPRDEDDLLSTLLHWPLQSPAPAAHPPENEPQNPQKEAPPLQPLAWNPPARPPQAKSAADRFWREADEDALPPPDYRAFEAARILPPRNSKQVKHMKKKRKALKKHRVRRFFATALALVLLLACGVYCLAFALAGNADKHSPIAAPGPSRLVVTNILLVGLDRESAGVRGNGPGRSDTVLLLSIDRRQGKMKLTSFMRDSWLPLPDGHYNKLNAAFHIGGTPLLMQALSGNFDLRIDHYVVLDFTGFAVMIDALGGVSVPVTQREAQFLCNTTRLGKQIGLNSMVEQMQQKGSVDMTGEQALIYCRIRKLDDDFQRTQRQRKVLGAVLQKLKRNPLRMAAAGKFLPYMQTDMSQGGLAALATAAPLYFSYDVEEYQVPAQGTWYYDNMGGASVIVLDLSANTKRLHDFIFGQ